MAKTCSQFGITQIFTAAYHPATNGLVERVKGKMLEIVRLIMHDLLDNWEDWLLHIAASINISMNDTTRTSLHYILFGIERRLPFDLLTSTQQPVYNIGKYSQKQIHVSSKINSCHKKKKKKMKATKAVVVPNQHKRTIPVNIKQGDTVMI